MSKLTALILESFDSLPPNEQHEVLTEMLRRARELPEDFLTDEQLVGLADDLFQALDAEESDEQQAGAK